MKSKVYFTSLRARQEADSLLQKVGRLFDRAGLAQSISPGDLVGIKLHFGERGNTAFLRPIYVRQVVERVKAAGGKPYLVDSNTLYLGSRHNAVDHLNTAILNGFAYAVVDAPLIIGDGLRGKDYREVEVNLKHCRTVRLAANVIGADALVVVSHVKGHLVTGLGGAIKNLAMGGASRGGKQLMHSSLRPEVEDGKCRGCGNCAKWCPAGAIAIAGGRAVLDREKCEGCGECPVNCAFGAIKIQWDEKTWIVQERMAEFVYGFHQEMPGKIGYMNFVMDVSPDCDCYSWSDAPVVPDVGILASTDPVAIDQASLDLVSAQAGFANSALKENHAPGKDKFAGIHPGVDPTVQLAYGERLGLGSREYDLIEVK
ncbi:MAG: DUF362 domain-containing protein [Bacillota bacterium]|nr:DUF362 domain-containing protein [Bacillota bacterium]